MRPDFVLLQDATREQLLTTDLAFCSFSRAEVEAGLVGSAVDRMMELSDDDLIARHLEARVVLMFDGYDEDPRELYEIPHVVRFFRSLTDAWPLWFHFLERRGDSLGVAMRLLTDVRVLGRGGGECRADMDAEAYAHQLRRLFDGLNGLHARLGLNARQTIAATDQILSRVAP